MGIIIAYAVIFIVSIVAPARISLVLLIINLFIPDPLPFVDEFIQVAIIIGKVALGDV